MKSPNFENCQVGLDENGSIVKVSDAFSSWVGKGGDELEGQNFRTFFLSLEKSWENQPSMGFDNYFSNFYVKPFYRSRGQ